MPWLFWTVLALVLTTLGCLLSPRVKFYIKSVVMYSMFGLNSIITVPYGLWHFKKFRETTLFCCSLSDFYSWILGISWSVTEVDENWDKKKSHVIVCNHQSSVDVLGMMVIWPHLGHTVAIAKNELKYLGPFGLCLYLCGTIFLDRISGEKGHKAINEAASKAKATGTSIWIYPEGTRNRKRDGTLLPFKKGAFHMAIDNKMSILPVVISEYDFMDTKKKIFETGHVDIKILEPISTEGFSKDTMQDLIDLTSSKMCQELKSMSNDSKKLN